MVSSIAIARVTVRLKFLEILPMDLNDQRREYRGIPLEVEAMPDCPVVAFKEWYEMAKQREVLESNAMSLATVDAAGRPARCQSFQAGFRGCSLVVVFDSDQQSENS